jgi:hypothetical protein
MDTVIQGIERRRWDVISERWRNYLPDRLDEMPNAYQAPAKESLLIDRMRGVGSSDVLHSIGDAPVIRTLIFEAARFCAERSLYFTRTAEQLAASGMPTASVTVSYLGMLFGSRSMQGFLGLYYCFFENSTWLIDVWPGASETSNQGRLKEWTPRIGAVINKQRMGHEHHWKLFIRLRAITTRLPLDDGAMSVLRKLKNHGSFSAQRNDVQYNDKWPYLDLYQRLNEAEFGLLPSGRDVDEDDSDHNLKVAQIMAFCSVHMLLDILIPLRKFNQYSAQLRRQLSPDWHPLLNAGALSIGLDRLLRRRVV